MVAIRNQVMLNSEQMEIIRDAVDVLNKHGGYEGKPITDIIAVIHDYRPNMFYLYTFAIKDDYKSNLIFLGAICYWEKTKEITVIQGKYLTEHNEYTVMENVPRTLADKVFAVG